MTPVTDWLRCHFDLEDLYDQRQVVRTDGRKMKSAGASDLHETMGVSRFEIPDIFCISPIESWNPTLES